MKARKKTGYRRRFSVKELFTAKLPSAITSRISPLLTVGSATLLSSVILLFFPTLRLSAPLFAILGAVIILYALWQKADVLMHGYDEHVFKVVDYSQILPFTTKIAPPTGLFLMRKTPEGEPEDCSIYHVAVSAKGNLLPPIDWLIRVYVPKGMEAVTYGDKKYFPTVYGYRIEGEDK